MNSLHGLNNASMRDNYVSPQNCKLPTKKKKKNAHTQLGQINKLSQSTTLYTLGALTYTLLGYFICMT